MRAMGAGLVSSTPWPGRRPRAKNGQTEQRRNPAPKPSRRRDRNAKARPRLAAASRATNGSAAAARDRRADTYAAIPQADRLAIQYDLTWGGDYNGPIDGEFSDRRGGLKAYQHDARSGNRRDEPAGARRSLAARRGQAGAGRLARWSTIPSPARASACPKQVPNKSQDQERHALVFRARPVAGRDLPDRTPAQRSSRLRAAEESAAPQLEINFLQPDFFVISGMQGLKKFYVRG